MNVCSFKVPVNMNVYKCHSDIYTVYGRVSLLEGKHYDTLFTFQTLCLLFMQCSASCGTGLTSRKVVCIDNTGRKVDEDACHVDHKPRLKKRCESNVGCGNNWFTGPWSQVCNMNTF